MAEVATPSTNGSATEKKIVVKPERPDEDAYKKAVTKAEKELNDAKAKFVSTIPQCACKVLDLTSALVLTSFYRMLCVPK
jgi:hypothetical protein